MDEGCDTSDLATPSCSSRRSGSALVDPFPCMVEGFRPIAIPRLEALPQTALHSLTHCAPNEGSSLHLTVLDLTVLGRIRAQQVQVLRGGGRRLLPRWVLVLDFGVFGFFSLSGRSHRHRPCPPRSWNPRWVRR